MIYTQEKDLPTTIAAYTVQKDGEYTIILNSRMSYERMKEAYAHEMYHIANGDFEKDNQELIETEAHGRRNVIGEENEMQAPVWELPYPGL